MAYTTINKPSATAFNTNLYTGNSTATSHAVGFQPDFTWLKVRNGSGGHYLFDSIRGATKNLRSDATNAEATDAQTLKSFDSNGYTVGTSNSVNTNNETMVGWNWTAGTAVSGNTSGSGTAKTYTGSVNTTSGFSIIKYTGNGTAGHTIPHHLGVAPSMIITKIISGDTSGWYAYHKSLGNTGNIFLDTTSAVSNSGAWWNSTTPTSSVFTVGDQTGNNSNNNPFIAYCFADVQGYSKVGGSYTGNGNADGPFIYLGFKPAFFLIKNINNASDDWHIMDNKRNGYNPQNNILQPNLSGAETSSTRVDFLSNGIKINSSSGYINRSGEKIIYMAFAEAPLVGTNNVPCTAR